MDKIKRYCYDRVLGMIEIHPKTVIKSEQYYKSSDVSALEEKLEEAVELLTAVRHKPSVLNPVWEKIFIFLTTIKEQK